MSHIKELIETLKQAHRLEAELKACLSKIDELSGPQGPIVSDWIRNGKSGEKFEDGLSCYLRTDTFCNKRKEVDTSTMCEALEASGLGPLISQGYSHQGLKAYVVERIMQRESEGDPVSDPMEVVPEMLRGLLNVSRRTKVVVRGLERPSVPRK